MKYSIYIIAVLLLTACQTERKAVKKIWKLHAAHPAATAVVCAALYPPLEYTRDSMVYKPGAAADLVYVYADCDTVADKQAGKLKIPCPPARAADTIFLYKEKQVVNRAATTALYNEISRCNNIRARLTRDRQILFWVALVMISYTLIRWGIKFWRIFM